MEEISEESRVEEGCRSVTSCHFAKAFLLFFVVGGLSWGRGKVRFFFFWEKLVGLQIYFDHNWQKFGVL